MFSFDEVKNADAEIYAAMADEMGRQRSHLELIASENLVSKGVMAAMGSHLTNKYAEGYPGKRFQAGSEVAAKTWSFKYAASQEFHDIMAQVIVNAKCLAEELQKYGIRIGLTAVSQRGLKEPEIREIAAIINQVAEAPEDEANLKACKAKAEALIAKFPLYPAGSFDD